jgi:hypothetical protein
VKDLSWEEFQDTVAGCLVRHKSIIDVLAKIHETSARVNRAVSKSVTSCGCIQINAKKTASPQRDPSLRTDILHGYSYQGKALHQLPRNNRAGNRKSSFLSCSFVQHFGPELKGYHLCRK